MAKRGKPEFLRVTIDPDQAVKSLRYLAKLKDRKRIFRAATRAAAGEQMKVTKKLLPKKTGELRKSLTIKVKQQGGAYVATIHARKGKDPKRSPRRYLHLVEAGTKPHPQPNVRIRLPNGTWTQGVYHPGSRGARALARASTFAQARATQRFGAKIREEVRKLNRWFGGKSKRGRKR